MGQSTQWFVIAMLFLGALIYLFSRIQKSSKGETCAGSSCNCKSEVTPKEPLHLNKLQNF
jgi:hypothetical protein